MNHKHYYQIANRINTALMYAQRVLPEGASAQLIEDVDVIKKRYSELKLHNSFDKAESIAKAEYILKVINANFP